jgi:hypothetical protein
LPQQQQPAIGADITTIEADINARRPSFESGT